MRIAMSCFAFPDFGRPTRRERFSSSPVDSGRSEKSIRSSCVSFALFRARAARGDDTKRFFAIFQSPVGINQNDDTALNRDPQPLKSILTMGVFHIFPFECIGIGKNGGRFLERDAMLLKIPGGFPGIPGEHNLCIYNNYYACVKDETSLVTDRSKFRGCPLEIGSFRLVDFDSCGQYKNSDADRLYGPRK
jgi:hypothetical protein